MRDHISVGLQTPYFDEAKTDAANHDLSIAVAARGRFGSDPLGDASWINLPSLPFATELSYCASTQDASFAQRRYTRGFGGAAYKWLSNQSEARPATRSRAPGASNKCVAPGTITTCLGPPRHSSARRLSARTCVSAPPTISSVGAVTCASAPPLRDPAVRLATRQRGHRSDEPRPQ